MMLFCSVHQELSEKQKPPTHQGGGFNPPAEIYLVSLLTTHRRKFSFPIKGTLALHCQVARLVSESFLMLVRTVSTSRRTCNKILCHKKQRDPSVSQYNVLFGISVGSHARVISGEHSGKRIFRRARFLLKHPFDLVCLHQALLFKVVAIGEMPTARRGTVILFCQTQHILTECLFGYCLIICRALGIFPRNLDSLGLLGSLVFFGLPPDLLSPSG